MRMLGLHIVLDAGKHAKFSFNRYIVLVSVLNDLRGQLHILVIRMV